MIGPSFVCSPTRRARSVPDGRWFAATLARCALAARSGPAIRIHHACRGPCPRKGGRRCLEFRADAGRHLDGGGRGGSFCRGVGGRAKWTAETSLEAPHEAKLLAIDSSRARELGWQPRWRSAEAIERTAACIATIRWNERHYARQTRRQKFLDLNRHRYGGSDFRKAGIIAVFAVWGCNR